MKKVLNKKIIAFLTALVIAIGTLSGLQVTAGGYVYVDDDAKGEMDGSSDNPYDNIQDAIDEAEKEDSDVKIRKGTYRENIRIWEDVEIYGSDMDEVVIIADDDDEAVVEMYHDTALRNVTVREGEVGIEVREGSKVLINKCKVEENDEDGIRIKEADIDHTKEIIIISSIIENNDWTGIYMENRKFKFEDNYILNNGKDGIDLGRDSEGSVRDNQIKDNEGVGIKVRIDGAEVYIKKNTLRDNERDGIEIRTKGDRGFVQIEDNKLYQNDRWGIARVASRPFSDDDWFASLKIISNNIYWENDYGAVAPVYDAY
ncbi:MAG: right-handed parallel beta-helix repeat-containing protein [Patescibacteria group bacterium]|jgi:parallel beta-helix repeat protein|nr:right-handed parallel beta-helix repeat-containing protein [Patescibacteria group bacterium]